MSSVSSQTNGAAPSGVNRKAPLPIPRRNGAHQSGSPSKTAPSMGDTAINIAPSPVITVKKPRLEDFCGPDTPPIGVRSSCAKHESQSCVDQLSKAVTGPYAGQNLCTPNTRRTVDGAHPPATPKRVPRSPTLDPRRRPYSSMHVVKQQDPADTSSLSRPQCEIDRDEPMDTDESDSKGVHQSPEDDETSSNNSERTVLDKATADMRELGDQVKSARIDDRADSGAVHIYHTKPSPTSIRRFLEKCGLGQHCDAYVAHFKNMGIPTCQDLDALIMYNLDGQLLNLLKKDCNGRWLQINLIKNGLEKHRRALLRKMGGSPAST